MNVRFDPHRGAAGLPALDGLLAPLAPDAPCGPSVRHDPVFTDIRLLREEDDPSLPMGQWERPLKRADWARIEALCTGMLAQRSKDLQIALWLAESWMRQHGLAGLAHGLALVDGLLRRYWTTLHPAVEDDGDADARLACLEWLGESLGHGVRLHAVLFTVEGDKPAPITLAEWERMTVLEMAAQDERPTGLARADVGAQLARLGPELARAGAAAGACLDAVQSIAAFVRERLGDDAPNLARLAGAVEAILRVLAQLQPVPQPVMAQAAVETVAVVTEPPVDSEPMVAAPAPNPVGWRNRGEAYATLEALADYLSEVEPHSPTPFLIRRAANWGRMSLPEVIAEIIREEGDASRLFNVLGIKL